MLSIWLESLRAAWMTLRANRLRTALTALSVGLGACTMALLVSLATSALATIMTGVDAVGGREIVFVEPKDDPKGVSTPITREDAASLRRVPGVVDVAYYMSMRNQPLVGNGHNLDVDIAIGTTYPNMLMQEIAFGSFNTDDTDTTRRIVLTEPIAKELFGSDSAALGKTVTLWQKHWLVTGVTHEKPALGFNMGGVSRARAVFITSAAALSGEGITPRGFIVMRDDGKGDHDLEISVAGSILRYRHRNANDIEFFDMRSFLRIFDIVFIGIRVVVGLIAAVSLFVAGAGIMNVMFASARQRVSEIGIRRAVGASSADIRRQFLFESIILATIGGIGGSAIGTGIAAAVGALVAKGSPAFQNRPSLAAAIIAVIAAGTVGLVFGTRPARRAAGMWVVDCLRGVSR